MIDTINLSVVGLAKHVELTEYLHNHNKREGLSKFVKVVGIDDELDTSQKIRLQNKTRFHETGEEVETMYWNKIPSYNYNVAYQINWNADCIKFNISLPKYEYGTNVFMLLPPYFSRDYEKRKDMSTIQLLYKSYDDLKKFVNRFFIENFRDIYVDMFDVQLTQIHLCFNYVMRSKEDALMCIENLKRTKKKFYREGKGGKGSYDTGIYFPSKAVTFKIYHKGAEFRKHDKKELQKKRTKNDKPLYAINVIEELADRTVRYEMEFRNRGMNDVMKAKVFRKNDEFYQSSKRAFYKYRHGSLFKTKAGKKAYADLPRVMKKRIKFVEHVQNKSFLFFMEGNPVWTIDSRLDKGLINNVYEEGFYSELDQPYTYELHKALCNRFMKQIEEFKPNMIADIFYILKGFRFDKERDDKIRKKVGKDRTETCGISESTLKTILEQLERYSFDEMIEQGFIKQRTMRRYLTYLEKYGVRRNAVSGDEIDLMPNNILYYDDFVKDNFVYLKNSLNLKLNY